MAIRLNRSITNYLQRKNVLPIRTPRPKFEMRALHAHSRPVDPVAPYLHEVESPATKVRTEEL